MQVYKKVKVDVDIPAGTVPAIPVNRIPFGDENEALESSPELLFDGTQMIMQGSSANRLLRFVESTGAFNGFFIHADGGANKFHIGRHHTGNADTADDVAILTFLRGSNYMGIMNDNPTAALDLNGTAKFNGTARIDPTFAEFPSVAIGNPRFGGSRLGDSLLQSPTIDTEILTFRGNNQESQVVIFINESGNTMSVKGFDDGILLMDITSKAVDWSTEFAEATLARSIENTDGSRYVYDSGVQKYHTQGSLVSNCFFNVLINSGAAPRMKKVTTFYDGTTYDQIQEIQTDGKYKFFYPVKGQPAVADDELVTLDQLKGTEFQSTLAGSGTAACDIASKVSVKTMPWGWIFKGKIEDISATGGFNMKFDIDTVDALAGSGYISLSDTVGQCQAYGITGNYRDLSVTVTSSQIIISAIDDVSGTFYNWGDAVFRSDAYLRFNITI